MKKIWFIVALVLVNCILVGLVIAGRDTAKKPENVIDNTPTPIEGDIDNPEPEIIYEVNLSEEEKEEIRQKEELTAKFQKAVDAEFIDEIPTDLTVGDHSINIDYDFIDVYEDEEQFLYPDGMIRSVSCMNTTGDYDCTFEVIKNDKSLNDLLTVGSRVHLSRAYCDGVSEGSVSSIEGDKIHISCDNGNSVNVNYAPFESGDILIIKE